MPSSFSAAAPKSERYSACGPWLKQNPSNIEVLHDSPISCDDCSNNVTALPERVSSAAVVRPAAPHPIITTYELSISLDIGNYLPINMLLNIAFLLSE
jgi:hypothetical protein